jgi:hypothetical protein
VGWKAESVQGILERRLDMGPGVAEERAIDELCSLRRKGRCRGTAQKIKPESQSDCDLGLIFWVVVVVVEEP